MVQKKHRSPDAVIYSFLQGVAAPESVERKCVFMKKTKLKGFDELQKELKKQASLEEPVLPCPHCGKSFPIKIGNNICPHCGGIVERKK